jgi:Cu-Zn family superoxide dismutase
MAGHHGAAPERAVAVLAPTAGNTASGTVTFEVVDGGVRIVAQVEGLSAGPHGFHIHEFGDCSAADGTSAGGHFNPTGSQHGAPDAAERHIGDLGNLEADTQGMAAYDRVDPIVNLSGPRGIIGRAVIVHGGADDLTSQPTGAAGARVACGVIGLGG